ncbi:MAG TPA: hypothetical protein PLB89_11400 [Flavobacteriales bacterium]|nr:hypothetical protein [Flavobacteriales bacterium]
MRTLTALVLASAVASAFAQNGVAPIYQRIGSFASEAKRTLDAMDPTTETEETCALYALIETTTGTLARELRGDKPCVPYPSSEIATAQALAYYYQPSCPDMAAYYTVVGALALPNAILAHAPPTGYNTLMEVSDLARFADKAHTAERLARRHRLLTKRMADLEELMATR